MEFGRIPKEELKEWLKGGQYRIWPRVSYDILPHHFRQRLRGHASRRGLYVRIYQMPDGRVEFEFYDPNEGPTGKQMN